MGQIAGVKEHCRPAFVLPGAQSDVFARRQKSESKDDKETERAGENAGKPRAASGTPARCLPSPLNTETRGSARSIAAKILSVAQALPRRQSPCSRSNYASLEARL